MILKVFKFLIISSLSLTFYLAVVFSINFLNNDHYTNIQDRIKWTIKDTIFANKELKFWKDEYEFNVKKIQKLENEILEKDYLLAEIPNLVKRIPVKKNITEKYNLDKANFTLEKFKTNYLTTSKHPGALGSSYIDFADNKLFLVSGNGIIAFTETDNFKSESEFDFKLIKTNIKDIVKDELFYINSEVGVKDVLIKKGKIYISFTKLQNSKEECYNTSILVSDINTKVMNFEELFNPVECVKRNNDYGDFTAVQSGGRMISIDDQNIFLTVGDFRYRDHAQNPDNTFGTLQKINLITKKNKLVAYGLRNSQGLYYNSLENKIILTDHGPKGGDEINILDYDLEKEYNFGWPISSYGEHYGIDKDDKDHPLYIKAPLYKSHKKYGFKEPMKYFDPSIGISEIVMLPSKFLKNKNDNKNFLYGSLGKNPEEGDMSIQLITFDNNYNELSNQIMSINERVRDIIYIEKLNKVFLMLETSASIGVLDII